MAADTLDAMTSLPEAFPPDDPVARFVLAMTMAGNDIDRTLRLAGEANTVDSPDFTSYVRWSMGFFFEAQLALAAYRTEFPEVQEFLRTLPSDARKQLKVVAGVEQKLGGKLAEHTRNHSFHFPHPSAKHDPDGDERLREAVRPLTGEPVCIVTAHDPDGNLAEVHYDFANRAALAVAFAPYEVDNDDKLRAQNRLARDAAIAFRDLAHQLLTAYLDSLPGEVCLTDIPPGGAATG